MNYHQIKQYLQNNLWRGENSHEHNLKRHFFPTLLAPDTSRVWGIDISHWNLPPVDLKRMVDLFGLKFVFIKGCDGALNTRYYFEHVAAAKAAGVPWGMYCWLYPYNRVSLEAQATAWVARARVDPPPLGIAIDAEWTNYGGEEANPRASDLRQVHDKVKVKSGRSAMTYTAPGYANTYLIGFDWSREPLWNASWGGNTPLLPTGAHGWDFWQFGILDGKVLDPTGNFEMDGDYYNGSLESFNAEFGLTETPPTGGPMDKYMEVTDAVTSSLNIRTSGANLGTGNDLGAFNLLRGDVIHVIGNNAARYQQFDKLYRAGLLLTELPTSPTGQYWAVEVDGNYVLLEDIEFTPPAPPVVTIESVDIHLAPGSTVTTKRSDGTETVETA